ncbi:alpha/beta hydrolase [Christiangramia flava]|uniref:alpha/beta hydrolase n=1 Tax=Christiangramia flava TaxID=1486245 RepID=UPI0009FA2514|nr:prolyl oligopeptidase family serine peptidase [Christiangramia flava]
MGFSAGGHLAATLSTKFDLQIYETDQISARPNFSALIYPVISLDEDITHMGFRNNLLGENASDEQVNAFSNELNVSSNTPPVFLVHANDDHAVPVQNSIRYFRLLKMSEWPFTSQQVYYHKRHLINRVNSVLVYYALIILYLILA